MEVVCIDASNKPAQIQQKNWPKMHKVYTVVKIKQAISNGEPCFFLEEIQPDPPFEAYAARRFVPLYDIDITQADEILMQKEAETII